MLERAEHHRRLASPERLQLERLAHRDEKRLGRAANGQPLGQVLPGRRRGGSGAGQRQRLPPVGEMSLRPPEQPALTQHSDHLLRERRVLLGLQALGEQQRVRPLDLRSDGVDDLRHLDGGALLHQPQVELDDVGGQERQQCQGVRLRTDVIDGEPPAVLRHPGDGRQQLGRPARERPLRDGPSGCGDQVCLDVVGRAAGPVAGAWSATLRGQVVEVALSRTTLWHLGLRRCAGFISRWGSTAIL